MKKPTGKTWISVNDYVPNATDYFKTDIDDTEIYEGNKSDYVLCYPADHNDSGITIARYVEILKDGKKTNDILWDDIEGGTPDITHWMPLPLSPKI